MRKKRTLIFSIVLFLFVLMLKFDFFRSTGNVTLTEDYSCKDCNVILLVSETLRADHLGFYGYDRDTGPALDEFAENSIAFMQAISQAPWTAASVASIMTSLYPHVNGLNQDDVKLRDSVTTLAEIMKENGLITSAFQTNAVAGHDYNLAQGFDNYVFRGQVNGGVINGLAIDWLKNNRDKRFFLYVHYYDPHHPYAHDKPYRIFYEDYSGPITTPWEEGGKTTPARQGYYRNGIKLTDEDKKYVASLYDADIWQLSTYFNDFIDELERMGVMENTIIVFVGDHGEEFWEHGSYEHGHSVYEELVHVPLFIKLPVNYTNKVYNVVSSVDIMPTILDILDIDYNGVMNGRSLMPLIAGKDMEKRPAFSEATTIGDKKSIRTDEWKLIFDADKGYELYNIKKDHGEKNNVIDKHPEVFKELKKQIDGWLQLNIGIEEAERLNEEESERIRSLGYLV